MADTSEKTNAQIDAYYAKLVAAAQQGMVEGMRQFETYEIKTEMSGRPGLKRGSGALAGRWHLIQEGEGLNYKVKLSNDPTTWYAKVHQTGMTIRPRNAEYLHFKLPDGSYRMSKEVTIPKRLNIYENYATMGKEFIMTKMKQAIANLHKGGGTAGV